MSVTHLDPSDFIFELNHYRIKNICHPIRLCGYLQLQCKEHTKRVLNEDWGFRCSDPEVTQRAGSFLFCKLDEFCAKVHYTEPIFDSLIKNDKIFALFNYPFYNVLGISMFSCGNYIYLFCMMGETR